MRPTSRFAVVYATTRAPTDQEIHTHRNPHADLFAAICNARELSDADRRWARLMRSAFRRYRCLTSKQIAVVEGLCRKLGVRIDGKVLFGYG